MSNIDSDGAGSGTASAGDDVECRQSHPASASSCFFLVARDKYGRLGLKMHHNLQADCFDDSGLKPEEEAPDADADVSEKAE